MKISAPIVPSNLINSQEKYFIRFGKLLRNSGIDELPQFYNILKGDMSFVGPRPVIINEYDIITKRNEKGINKLKPGLTGLAQIKGRDKLSVKEKIKYDEIYMQKTNLVLDLKIILLTNYWLFCENILKNFNKLSDVLIINEHD
jgi:O-antigen biosynthesis protein WbqP